jgi:hypothetical protein
MRLRNAVIAADDPSPACKGGVHDFGKNQGLGSAK